MGDFTARIFLDAPFPAALEFLSGPVVIYPDQYFAEVGAEGMATAPISTGLYKVVDYTHGELNGLQPFPITFKLASPAVNLGVRHGSVVVGTRWGHSNTIQAG